MRLANFSMFAYAFLLVALMMVLVGCGGSSEQSASDGDSHEHASQDDGHSAPADFATGVAMLKKEYEAIKTAFEAGKPDEAHDPLHEVGHTLEALPELAKSAELSDEQIEEVKDAVDKMFGAYGEVDGAMHDGKEPDYAAVAETLDQCMAQLEAAAGN